MRTEFVFAALAALAIVTPAGADDCNKPLKLVTTLPLTPLGDGVMTVPVTINGVPKQFLFDTGGVLQQVSAAVADELKLREFDSPLELYGVDGGISRKYTSVEKFGLGNLPGSRAELLVAPDSDIDGVVSPVAYGALDFDMDFAAGKLNLLLGDHCEGKVVYWPAKAVAAVPITIDAYHIRVPVTVDGHSLTAIIDTGSDTSTLRMDMARRAFGLTPDSPDMKAVGHVGSDENALTYEHPFKTLSFGGVTVTNPRIQILTDIVNKNADRDKETGSLVRETRDSLTLPEVIVGMDVLRQLHVYLAMSEKRLYVTEAGNPAAAAPAKASAP